MSHLLLVLFAVFWMVVGFLLFCRWYLKRHFEDGHDRDSNSGLEVFRPMFQDRNARFEESRRFEWVHLSAYRQARDNLPPIYP